MMGFYLFISVFIAAATTGALAAEDRVQFYYFSQQNPGDAQLLKLGDPDSVNASYFDPTKQTMVLIHGFLESVNFTQLADMRIIYISSFDHNVISVNYDGYKPSDGDIYLYYQSVGTFVCEFINYLMDDFKLKPDDTYIIGHSVGVHVAGETGKCLKKRNNQVRRITGLDPANWKDLGTSTMDILRPTDAKTVDCIHTSTTFGIHTPICGCNYYAHGGNKQPECENANEVGQLIGLCDHLSSFRYYQRSLENPERYPAYKCAGTDAGNVTDCETTTSGFMGNNEDKYCTSGIFNVPEPDV